MSIRNTVAAVALTLAAAPVAALEVQKIPGQSAFGSPALYVNTNYSVVGPPSGSGGAAAGMFRLQYSEDGGSSFADFLAFCLQPLETLTLPKTHTEGSTLAQSVLDDLNALASNVWGQLESITSASSSADIATAKNIAGATQMAVWEIANETDVDGLGDVIYDIDAGNFSITRDSAASNTAEATAQGYLDNIANGTWSAGSSSFRIFSAAGTQDLLTNLSADNNTPEIPLPATGLLMIAGLGALAAKRKRS